VPTGTIEVQVLRVGYTSLKKRATVQSGSTTVVDFQLSPSVVQLEEIVTTATGQQRRVELGNAVSTLGDVGKRVETIPTKNISDLLIAKSPGVVLLPATELGGAPTVRIRGVSSISLSNAPIWYVDGVRYSAGTLSSGTDVGFSLLNSLNPEEIEDVEIVKGPSAATLYGTNAANGVVLITTKKGRAGRTNWNWTVEQGNVVDRVPYEAMYANWGHDPANASKQIRCQLWNMQTPQFSVSQGATCISDSLTYYNYMKDKDRTFVSKGNRSLYGAQVSGGNETVRFFAGGDLENETGPIEMQDFYVRRFEDTLKVPVRDEWRHPSALQKGSFRANLNAALSPKFDLNVSSGFMKSDTRIPPESDLIIALYYVGMQNYGFKGPGLDKITAQADGTPLYDALQWSPGDIMQVTQNSDVQRFTGSASGSWRPFNWMQNEGTVGVDLAAVNFFQLCRLNECPPQSATARLGRVTDNQSKNRNFSSKITSTSSWNPRTWLNLKTSVGGDYTNIESDFANTNGTGLPPGASSVTAASTRVGTNQQPTAVKTLGLYVQEQAGINDRLFVTGAIRTDQNSAFGTNFQKVYYPKVSVSWLVSEESYFPRYSWLNSFRIRSAYGASGVQPGATAALITYAAGSTNIPGRTSTATTGTDTPNLLANQPGNANLKPEKSSELETGFETQLFGRLNLDYTFWNKQTKDALIQIPLAYSSGAAQISPLQNIGATKGWGHELTARLQVLDRRLIGWDMQVTGSHLSNKVVDLGIDPNTGQARTIGTGQTRQIPGLPLYSQWFRPYTFADKNGDGLLQRSEVVVDSTFVYVGYTVPRDLVSVSSGLDLFDRRVRINTMFDYKGGFSTQDGANNFQCNTGPFACRETQDPTAPLWKQARAIAKTYGTTYPNGANFKTTLGYFMNGQFWKWRELSAVVQMPQTLNKYLRAQNGSTVVFGARNLWTWTSFTGIDPEANYGLSGNETQNEFQTTGAPTYYTIRLNLKY
jgi:TonB-dependent SusC/RagA subfamily outer membrane receptor